MSVSRKKYVLWWMQSAQRGQWNPALEAAVRRANEFEVPVLGVFGITDNYPGANLRHYHFMLEGLADAQEALVKRGIKLVVKHQSPELAVVELAKDACFVVGDTGFSRVQRKWREYVSKKVKCPFEQVESNLIVPVVEASDKENFSAGVFRPRINKRLSEYLVKMRQSKVLRSSVGMKISSFDICDIGKALSKLDIDRSVGPVTKFRGGTSEAKKRLGSFIKDRLDDYAEMRNDPCVDGTSNLSPYLHFGQISPLYVALKVAESGKAGSEAFLEEFIVRRELSYNFVYYNMEYDNYSCLPGWAKNTLRFHGRDKREYVYSVEEFERAETHDVYWNAAQKEMVLAGKMHGYMRMYWGKKILEWSRSPREGFRIAVYLNDKYELDGRDANGYAGVAWCFGKHDRAWGERAVFGKVRYMNAAGLKRKFDADGYVEKIMQLEKKLTGQ